MTTELSRRAGMALAAATKARQIKPEEVEEFTRAVQRVDLIDDLDPRWRELIEKYAPED